MQFIVKPNPSSPLTIVRRCGRLYSLNLIYGAAVLVLFSTGFMLGLLWNADSSCLSEPTREIHKQHASAPSQSAIVEREKTTLLILIMSGPQNLDKRSAIRDTWVNLIDQRPAQYFFALGTAGLNNKQLKLINDEQSRYLDLLIFPEHKDNYGNITTKLLLSLKHFHQKFEFDFLLKVDDDSFANVDKLFQALASHNTKRLYMGYFQGHANVKKKGKWSESNWFLCDHYLPYALGGGYVISGDLVAYIANSAELLQLYSNEDVSLGTWLAPLKIKRVHDVRFDTEYRSRGCSNDHLISHKQSPANMRERFGYLTKYGKLCLVENMGRKSYIYNWTVLPSDCCNFN